MQPGMLFSGLAGAYALQLAKHGLVEELIVGTLIGLCVGWFMSRKEKA